MAENSENTPQLDLFQDSPSVVHFWDKNGALHTGYVVRKIKQGKRKGQYIVRDLNGKKHRPFKIRNIETK